MEAISGNEQRQQQQQHGFVPKISGGRKGGCFIAPKIGDASIKDLIARQGPSPFLNVDPNAKARIGEIFFLGEEFFFHRRPFLTRQDSARGER